MPKALRSGVMLEIVILPIKKYGHRSYDVMTCCVYLRGPPRRQRTSQAAMTTDYQNDPWMTLVAGLTLANPHVMRLKYKKYLRSKHQRNYYNCRAPSPLLRRQCRTIRCASVFSTVDGGCLMKSLRTLPSFFRHTRIPQRLQVF